MASILARPLRLRGPRAAALLFALLAVASCKGVEIMGTAGAPRGGSVLTGGGTGTGGGAGGGSVSTAVVGKWARVVVLQGGDGAVHESRTEWEFRSDGSATRRVTAWNVTDGVYDTIVANARWSTAGSTLTIAWLSPASGGFTLDWRVDGDVLTIGPDQFARVR